MKSENEKRSYYRQGTTPKIEQMNIIKKIEKIVKITKNAFVVLMINTHL